MKILQDLKWTDSALALQEQGILKKINLNPQELNYRITLKKYASDEQSIKLLVPLNTIVKEQNKVILEGEPFISQEKGFITAIELIRAEDEATLAEYYFPESQVMPVEELNLLFTLPLQSKKISFSPSLLSQSILEQPQQLHEVFKSSFSANNLKADQLELIGMYYDGLENIYCLAITIPNQTLHLFTYNLNPFAKKKFKNKYVGEIKEKSSCFQAVMAGCNENEISWYILTDKQILEVTASDKKGSFKDKEMIVKYKGNYKNASLFTFLQWPCAIEGKTFHYWGQKIENLLLYPRSKPMVIPFFNFYCIIGGLNISEPLVEYFRLPYLNFSGGTMVSNSHPGGFKYLGAAKEFKATAFRDIQENYATWSKVINSSDNCACVLGNKILIFNQQSFENNEDNKNSGYFYSFEPITCKWQRYLLASPFSQQQDEDDFFDFPGSENSNNNLNFKVCNIRDKACIAFLDYKKDQGQSQISLSLYQLTA